MDLDIRFSTIDPQARRRIKIYLSVPVITAILLVLAVAPRPFSEMPRYKGRPLADWYWDLGEGHSPEVRRQAEQVLLEMAAHRTQGFLAALGAKDSKFKAKLLSLVGSRPAFGLVSAQERREGAISEFFFWGPGARLAVTGLTDLLRDNETAPIAIRALAVAGTNGLSQVILATSSTNAAIRDQALFVLTGVYENLKGTQGRIYGGYSEAVFSPEAILPILIAHLDDSDKQVRSTAFYCLGRLKIAPEVVMPILKRKLNDPDFLTRMHALRAAELYGTNAEPVLPEVNRMLRDPRGDIRIGATNAIRRIDKSWSVAGAAR